MVYAPGKEFWALLFNFVSSVLIIIINKMVFSVVNFRWPAALTVLHYMVTLVLLRLLACCKCFEVAPASPMTPRLYWLSFLMGISPIINNMSLDMNSVGVYQTSKLLLIPVVVLAELVTLKKRVSPRRALLLILVVLGTAMSVATDFASTWAGVAIAAVWLPLSAMLKVSWAAAEKEDGWTTLPLLNKLMPLATVWMMLLTPIFDPPGLTEFEWGPYSVALLGLSGIAAFFVNYSGNQVLGVCSPLTHTLLGQGKSSVIMLTGFLLLDYNPGVKSLVGAAVAVAAMIAYTKVNMDEAEERKAKDAAKQRAQVCSAVEVELSARSAADVVSVAHSGSGAAAGKAAV